MQEINPGPSAIRKAVNFSSIRRELLLSAGALALTSFLALPRRALARPQAAGDAASPDNKPLTPEERIREILVEHLDADPKIVVPAARLKEDLGADSLDVVELTMAFEGAFDLVIDDDSCGKWKTVGDVNQFVQAELAKKQKTPAAHLQFDPL